MAKQEKLGSIKRYGTRYGRSLKTRVAKIEKQYRGKHKCPYCNYEQARRKSVGIWNCSKCNSTFTGKAYAISKKPVIKAEEESQ